MNSPKITAASLLRIEERLRQERETFDQRKEHDAQWFKLRLRMGYMAAVLVPIVAFASGYVLFFHEDYPAVVVHSAAGTLFIDVLALAGAVWRIVFNQGKVGLEPTTSLKD